MNERNQLITGGSIPGLRLSLKTELDYSIMSVSLSNCKESTFGRIVWQE